MRLISESVFAAWTAAVVCAIHLVLATPISSANVTGVENVELVFATVLFRHGARTPISPYPTDPYNVPEAWNQTGWGQLTNEGKRQHFALGQWLKARYSSLVNKTYRPDEIYVRSTDVDRTLMSAMANLAGFYPPESGEEVWDADIHWQPIPVHTIPTKMDQVLAAEQECPRYDYLYKKYKQSDEHHAMKKKYHNAFKVLNEETGKTVNSFRTAQQIFSCLHIEHLAGKRLPEWTKQVYPEPLTEMSSLCFQSTTAWPEMARLKSGPLLREILLRFQSKMDETLRPNRSMWLYSAHDTTVANLLNILGVFDPPFDPPFTATVMLELWLVNKQPVVSLFYKNGTEDAIGQPIPIPKCGLQCPLEEMFKLYAAVLPVDWEGECEMNTLLLSYEEAKVGAGIVPMTILPASIIIVAILVLLLIVTGSTIQSRKLHNDPRWYLRMNM